MREILFLASIRRLVFLLAMSGLSASGAAAAESPTRANLEINMRSLEKKAVETLRTNFADSIEVRYLIEGYEEADEDNKKVAFDAIWIYVDITLKQKTKEPTADQKKAFEEIAEISQKHLDLRAAYDKAK